VNEINLKWIERSNMSKKGMYETEVKVEISGEILGVLLHLFAKLGFVDLGTTPQEDRYVEAVVSRGNAFDIKRYRAEGDKFYYTEKVWEEEDGLPVQKEIEREIGADEFRIAKETIPAVIQIDKNRHSFTASWKGREINLSIDTVKFGHSEKIRHFLEAEIIVKDKSEVPATKVFIQEFLADMLGMNTSQILEAPGMFALAFNKL
jgi:adenylate cyclase class IV